MINLLPRDWQKKLQREEMSKIVTVLGIVFFVAVLALILILILIRIFYASQLKSLEIDFDQKEREMAIFGVKENEDRAGRTGGLVSEIGDFYGRQTKTTEIFLRVADSLPSEMFLTGFTYISGKVNIGGFSPDRNTLVVFKNNLERCPEFKNVVFPPEDWLAAQNIDFSVNFEYVKNK